MGTPLYNTDIIPLTSRPTLTVMDDGDYFVILDTSTGKISKILKTNIMTALKITYDNTSGLTAETVQAALDELVVNLGSSDSAILALSGRLDTIEGTGEGSVAKAIDDAVSPLAEVVDTNRLYSDQQYIELKAKADSLQVKCNTLQAEVYTDAPILQYGAVEIIGDGYEADDTPIDVSANVVDGSLELEQKGLTITNLIENGYFSAGTTGVRILGGSLSVSNGNLLLTGDGTSDTLRLGFKVEDMALGTVQFMHALAKAENALNIAIEIKISDFVYGAIDGDIKVGSPSAFVKLASRFLRDMDYAGNNPIWVTIRATYVDSATANGKVMEIDGNYGVSTYNLTALGLDHITDTAILSNLLPYVDGTKNVGKMGLQILDADDAVTQTIFLPAIGNSLPNGVADSIKTVADGWEHTKRVGIKTFDGSENWAVDSNDTNTIRFYTYSQVMIDSTSGVGYIPDFPYLGIAIRSVDYESSGCSGSKWFELRVLKSRLSAETVTAFRSWLASNPITLIYQLATPITTHYDLPFPTSGKTIHRFAGEEKIALYGTGLTFSENVLTVLSAVKFVAGVMTDITSLATITGDTVTFSGVGATDVVFVQVEHDVDKPLGVLEHTPAVSNTASRLAAIEAWIAAQGA